MWFKPPVIQIALDYPTIEEALAMAEMGVKAGVDWLEVGTPLIVSQGVNTIGRLKRAFPNYPVLADYKTMDSGGRNVQLTKQQGGDVMTVCGNAPDETVRAAVAASKETGVRVVVDLIGVKDQAGRARQCEEWGVDLIYLHYGADQRRADGSRDSTQWCDEVMGALRNQTPVGVGTFGVEDGVRAAEKGAEVIVIGHPVISSADPLGALREYVRRVKEVWKSRP